jgi:hypothetical protein
MASIQVHVIDAVTLRTMARCICGAMRHVIRVCDQVQVQFQLLLLARRNHHTETRSVENVVCLVDLRMMDNHIDHYSVPNV